MDKFKEENKQMKEDDPEEYKRSISNTYYKLYNVKKKLIKKDYKLVEKIENEKQKEREKRKQEKETEILNKYYEYKVELERHRELNNYIRNEDYCKWILIILNQYCTRQN